MPVTEKKPTTLWRYVTIVVIVCLFTAVIIGQLVTLQLMHGTRYRARADRQSIRVLWLPALRGRIYDRNRFLLAGNRPSFDLDMNVSELRARHVTNNVRHLSILLQESPSNLWSALSPHKRFPYTPARVARDISFEQMVRVTERFHELPGVSLAVRPIRDYPAAARAAHVVGYVGSVPPEHPRLLSGDYTIHDRVGITGVERVSEDILHGHSGVEVIQVNYAARYHETLNRRPPIPGRDVILTLDIGLQETLESAFSNRVGAAVALDPRNGAIRALVSSPSYDPTLFAGPVSHEDYAALRDNPDRPLFNRALSGRYPLGSVFKLVTAIAGLETGVIAPDTVYRDPGVFQLGSMRVRNFRGARYGEITLPHALRVSANTFFCDLGHKVGIHALGYHARMLGFGAPTGIELPGEAAGILPDPAWKRRHRNEAWFPGDTVNMSIGHGFLLVTPLQVACLTAAIARDGVWYPPYIIDSYLLGRDTIQGPRRVAPMEVPLAKETLSAVQQGMWEVVNMPDGSGRRAALPTIDVAGKTGSAALGPRTYAWFAAYAPFDDPGLVIVVVVEDATTGGVDAAPIAQQGFAAYFAVTP